MTDMSDFFSRYFTGNASFADHLIYSRYLTANASFADFSIDSRYLTANADGLMKIPNMKINGQKDKTFGSLQL